MKRNARARSIPDYVDTLDGFRAVATFLVLIFHYWQQSWVSMVVRVGPVEVDFTPIVSIGSLGVELLFALSGFCLYYPFALHPQRRLHAGNYAYKRMVRILPTYFLCVIVCSVYQVGRLDPALLREQFIGNMTLTQMSTPSLAYNHLNPVLWSIAIEAQFLPALPAAAAAVSQKALLGHGGGVRHRRGLRMYLRDVDYSRIGWLMNQLPGMIDVYVGGMLARARRWAGQARARRRTARRAAPCVHAGGDDVRRNVLSGRDVHRRAALRERSGKSLAAGKCTRASSFPPPSAARSPPPCSAAAGCAACSATRSRASSARFPIRSICGTAGSRCGSRNGTCRPTRPSGRWTIPSGAGRICSCVWR